MISALLTSPASSSLDASDIAIAADSADEVDASDLRSSLKDFWLDRTFNCGLESTKERNDRWEPLSLPPENEVECRLLGEEDR